MRRVFRLAVRAASILAAVIGLGGLIVLFF
jgi:hypothetical protein